MGQHYRENHGRITDILSSMASREGREPVGGYGTYGWVRILPNQKYSPNLTLSNALRVGDDTIPRPHSGQRSCRWKLEDDNDPKKARSCRCSGDNSQSTVPVPSVSLLLLMLL